MKDRDTYVAAWLCLFIAVMVFAFIFSPIKQQEISPSQAVESTTSQEQHVPAQSLEFVFGDKVAGMIRSILPPLKAHIIFTEDKTGGRNLIPDHPWSNLKDKKFVMIVVNDPETNTLTRVTYEPFPH